MTIKKLPLTLTLSLPNLIYTRDEDPVWAKKPDPWLCTSNEGRLLKVY